jgi:hypothetical protein
MRDNSIRVGTLIMDMRFCVEIRNRLIEGYGCISGLTGVGDTGD